MNYTLKKHTEAFKYSFISMLNYIEYFKKMINVSQAFRNLLLFNIDSLKTEDNNEDSNKNVYLRIISLLENFTRSFSILYKINCDY